MSLAAASPRCDQWSWNRFWIERPTGEATFHGAIHHREAGPLLDIGKDVLDELLARDPARATAVIELWLAARAPQLAQLGLYGLTKSSHWKPLQKLERLLGEHLPAKMPFKVEAFRVLQEAYSYLSARARKRFLQSAERLYRQEIEERRQEPDRSRSANYEWFNVIVWLERAAPGDPLLKRAMMAVREAYPDFQPRDHPELDIVHSEARWVQPETVLTSEEIARLSLPQWLEQLNASRERDRQGQFDRDHRGGFLEETARAASNYLEWGLSFTRSLIENGLVEHEVWSRI